MDKDTKDVLVAVYNKLWDNINNKDSRLWTFLSVYGGAVAVTFTIGRVANVELYASLVILILTLWALFIVANASWWDLRNRLMIGGIERKLPDAMRGVVPRAYYETLGVPSMDKLNDASIMVLGLVGLAMYLRVMWPFFRLDSITSWEVLVPLLVLYIFIGLAAWWWVDRVESIVQEYYKTARQLREDSPLPPPGPAQVAQNGSPASAPLEAAVYEAATAVALAAENATKGVPVADRPSAAVVSETARLAVANAVTQAVNNVTAQLGQILRTAVQEAANTVGTAATQAAQAAAAQGAPAIVAQAAVNQVASAVEAAVRRQLVRQDLEEFANKEKDARTQVGWRVHVFVVLTAATAVFDFACLRNASFPALVYIGVFCQTVAASLYVWLALQYYYSPGTDLEAHHLRLLRDSPAGRKVSKRVSLGLIMFLVSAMLCTAGVSSGTSFPLHAVADTTTGIRGEREKLADQIESLRKRSLDIESKLRNEELADFLRKKDADKFLNKDEVADFLRKHDADRFLTKDEAKQTYAPKADVDAIRRDLPQKR